MEEGSEQMRVMERKGKEDVGVRRGKVQEEEEMGI